MILRHTAYNLLGLGLPLFAALLSIPLLIDGLGVARFGLLMLLWAIAGYFGLFDLGLGRALTQILSIKIADNEQNTIGPLVATAAWAMTALGAVAGLLLAVAAEPLVDQIKDVPDHAHMVDAIYVMALAMPAIILTSCFRGVLESTHAFAVLNLIRLPAGLITYLGPLALVLCGESRLDWISIILATARVIACGAYAYFALRRLPTGSGRFAAKAEHVKPLCVSGGWMTISNVVSPIVGYVDRFFVGTLISASAVAFYTTPLEVVTKLWIIPGAITTVIFPTLARLVSEPSARSAGIYAASIWWIFVVLFPITLLLGLFAEEILSLWISPAFARESAAVLQLCALGILLNCLAHVPLTLLQARGAARWAAAIHLAETPIFIALIWLLVAEFGVVGAALAWTARMALDTLLMFAASARLINLRAQDMLGPRFALGAFAVASGIPGALLEDSGSRALWALLVLASFFVAMQARRLWPSWAV